MACIKSCLDKMVGFSVGGILLLASGCYDEGERLIVMHEDGSPVLCPNKGDTRWTFKAPIIVDGEQAYVVRDEGEIDDTKKHVSAYVLAGSVEAGRVPWVQFSIYCGRSEEAFYVTPRLTRKDLSKTGKSEYVYFVSKKIPWRSHGGFLE